MKKFHNIQRYYSKIVLVNAKIPLKIRKFECQNGGDHQPKVFRTKLRIH